MRTLRAVAILFVSFSLVLVGMLAVTARPVQAATAAAAGECVAPAVAQSLPGQTTISQTPDAFAQTNGGVLAGVVMYLPQQVLVVGGTFSTVKQRSGTTVSAGHIAAIDMATGQVLWKATANGYVYAVTARNGSLYVGGSFTTINGVAKKGIAQLDAYTGALRSWTAVYPGVVRAIAVTDTAVYYGSATQLRAANPGTGQDIWGLPVAGGGVRALQVSPDSYERLYVGGLFSSVGGLAQHGLMMVYPAISGAVNPWFTPVLQPNSGTTGNAAWDGENPISLAYDTNTNYLLVGGAGLVNSLSAVNGWTGGFYWHYGAEGDIQAIAQVGTLAVDGWHRNHGNIYYGCPYNIFGGSQDAATGTFLTGWNPYLTGAVDTDPAKVNGGIQAIVPTYNKVIVLGQFNRWGANCTWYADGSVRPGYSCVAGQVQNGIAVYSRTG